MLPDTHEDYWEDASVSLGCGHSWGFPFTPARSLQSHDADVDPWIKKVAADDSFDSPPLRHDPERRQSCASTRIAEFHSASLARRSHSFPPAISSCVTLSIKEGGRFVLKETAARPSQQSCFRVERENGRLRLCLLEPENLDEGDEAYADPEAMAGQPTDNEPQEICGPSPDNDGKLECLSIGSNSESFKLTGDLSMCEGNLDSATCDAIADDRSHSCDGILGAVHVYAIVDGVPAVFDGTLTTQFEQPNADDAPGISDNDLCRVNVASLLDINMHLVDIDCSSPVRSEKMQSLDSRLVAATGACMDSVDGTLSSHIIPQMLEASSPSWAATDNASHIHPWHGSFANLSPSLGLIVS